MAFSQEEDSLDKLQSLYLPDKEIDTLLLSTQHNNNNHLTVKEKTDLLTTITSTISKWIETIHLTLFTLEQNVKQNNATNGDTQMVDEAVQKMNPIIDSLTTEIIELLDDIIDDDDDDDDNHQYKMIILSTKAGITKIQSEWSGLKHFLSSVKQSFSAIEDEKKLRQLMDHVLIQIDDLSLLIFQYQEQRSNGKNLASINNNNNINGMNTPSSSLFDFKDDITTTSNSSAPDDILIDIDNRVGPLFNDVEKIYNRMVASDTPPKDVSGVLSKRHRMVQERWECLRVEIDELKVDLKEDRWLAVFKQVADQVDAMMDGLDKTVEQCQQMVQQVFDWQQSLMTVGGLSSTLSTSSSSTTVTPQQQQQQQYPLPPKGILRSSKSHHSSNASVSSTSSSGSNSTPSSSQQQHQPIMIDHAKLRSIEKNFEAKYKYCTPLITKMLNMLGGGIAARVSENNATVTRHEQMVQRWQKLKSVMDDLRIRSLPDIEKFLIFERPISPAWSKVSGSDRSYKSPEPMSSSYDTMLMFDSYRSPSSNSIHSFSSNGGGHNRARSPLSSFNNNNNHHQQFVNNHNNHFSSSSTTNHFYNNNNNHNHNNNNHSMYEEMRRVRSVTPSSGTSNRNNDPIALWRSTHGASPINNNHHPHRTLARTTSSLSSYHYNNDILKPSNSDSSSVGSNPSSRFSTTSMMKHQSHTSWHEDPPVKQAITPVPNRPKSRQQQDELPLGGRRSVTPVRRSGTPSMIPRPKTPSSSSSPYNNDHTQIPRPRSSLLRSPPTVASPPSPPHVSKKTLNRKHSTPLLNQHHHHHSINGRGMTNIHDHQRLSTQTPPPPSSSARGRYYYDLTEEDEDDYNNYNDDDDDDYMMYGTSSNKNNNNGNNRQREKYKPDPKDPLDIEVAKIVNANPIRIICQRGPQSGRYFFGHELSSAPGGGRKSYTCKLMTYTDRDNRRNMNNNNNNNIASKLASIGKSRNKVLVRVGGGWEDLEVFFLEHHNLMISAH